MVIHLLRCHKGPTPVLYVTVSPPLATSHVVEQAFTGPFLRRQPIIRLCWAFCQDNWIVLYLARH